MIKPLNYLKIKINFKQPEVNTEEKSRPRSSERFPS